MMADSVPLGDTDFFGMTFRMGFELETEVGVGNPFGIYESNRHYYLFNCNQEEQPYLPAPNPHNW